MQIELNLNPVDERLLNLIIGNMEAGTNAGDIFTQLARDLIATVTDENAPEALLIQKVIDAHGREAK